MSNGIEHQPSVLFVCLGNICRSPMAEGAFRKAAERAKLDCTIDSAGTAAYHVNSPPDPRAVAEAAANGVDISGLRGRQLEMDDFYNFTHIFALDKANLAGIAAKAPRDGTAEVSLLLDAVPGSEGSGVIDPYYGDDGGFAVTWHDVSIAADHLVARFQNRKVSVGA